MVLATFSKDPAREHGSDSIFELKRIVHRKRKSDLVRPVFPRFWFPGAALHWT